MRADDWEDQFDRAQVERKVNVICMKWGQAYGPRWVNRLHGMVERNTTWQVRFVCFTDDPSGIDGNIECQPLPKVEFDPALGKFWPKLGMMQAGLGGLSGMTLFLDLDLVIIDSIDALFSHPGRFCIIRDWKDPHLGYGNSSVVRYFIGAERVVLDRFYATPASVIVETYASKEQNFLTKAVDEVTFWPADWCAPFALTCLPRNRVSRLFAKPVLPKGAKIVVFYGAITPESALHGEHASVKRENQTLWMRMRYRRFRPAPWIADYWHD